MSQRRYHSKSRHGCAQCKANRTKCDESRPICGRCSRIGADCSLATNRHAGLIFIPGQDTQDSVRGSSTRISQCRRSTYIGGTGTHPSHPPRGTSSPHPSCDPVAVHRAPSFSPGERDRLRLMSHYALHTARTLTELTVPADGDLSVWGSWVTAMASQHEFLLHGLLSTSSLHLALLGVSPKEHSVLAIRHQSLGAELFQPALSSLTRGNYDAVLAFSYLLTVHNLGIQRAFDLGADRIETVLQVLLLIRQSVMVVKSHHGMLQESRWALQLMTVDPLEASKKPLPHSVEDSLSMLRRRVLETVPEPDRAEMYMATLDALRINFAMANMFPKRQPAMGWFLLMTPSSYWAVLKSDFPDPMALAILAHYAVILLWMRHNIWFSSWGQDTIQAVRKALPKDWHASIEWSSEELERALATADG